jgi:hypothetical protein
MNCEEIRKAVADAVVGFARSEAEAVIKSIDLMTSRNWWKPR